MGIEVIFKGKNLLRLLEGLGAAMKISLISVIISIVLGIVLGMLMASKRPMINLILRIYLEIVRIMPQMVLLFIVFFGFTKLTGLNLSAETAALIVFSFWGSAEMADLVRGCLISIPPIQYESSQALGKTLWTYFSFGSLSFFINIKSNKKFNFASNVFVFNSE